jgi:hypothetical protein
MTSAEAHALKRGDLMVCTRPDSFRRVQVLADEVTENFVKVRYVGENVGYDVLNKNSPLWYWMTLR